MTKHLTYHASFSAHQSIYVLPCSVCSILVPDSVAPIAMSHIFHFYLVLLRECLLLHNSRCRDYQRVSIEPLVLVPRHRRRRHRRHHHRSRSRHRRPEHDIQEPTVPEQEVRVEHPRAKPTTPPSTSPPPSFGDSGFYSGKSPIGANSESQVERSAKLPSAHHRDLKSLPVLGLRFAIRAAPPGNWVPTPWNPEPAGPRILPPGFFQAKLKFGQSITPGSAFRQQISGTADPKKEAAPKQAVPKSEESKTGSPAAFLPQKTGKLKDRASQTCQQRSLLNPRRGQRPNLRINQHLLLFFRSKAGDDSGRAPGRRAPKCSIRPIIG